MIKVILYGIFFQKLLKLFIDEENLQFNMKIITNQNYEDIQ